MDNFYNDNEFHNIKCSFCKYEYHATYHYVSYKGAGSRLELKDVIKGNKPFKFLISTDCGAIFKCPKCNTTVYAEYKLFE